MLPYMALQAHAQLQQGPAAAEELLTLAAHPAAPISLCLNAFKVWPPCPEVLPALTQLKGYG